MTIEFPCNHCLQPLRVPDTSAGKSARCPKCKAISPVPAASAVLPAAPTPLPPPASATVPTAPGPNDALFAALKAATTPLASGPLPAAPSPEQGYSAPGWSANAPPAGLPIGDVAGRGSPAATHSHPSAPAPAVNPYASPAFAYQSTGATAGGERPGLPWEVEGAGFVSWWKTSQMCLSEPANAFRLMRQEGGIGSPMLFAALGLLLGFVGQSLWSLPARLMEANAGGGNNVWQQGLNAGLWEAGIGAVFTLFMATFGLFIIAAIYHICLLLVGGAKQGFETTYRVVAFSHGSIAWLQVVPCVGGCIVVVMLYVCLINGLASAQETTGGKAAAAVFVPLGVCAAVVAAGIAVAVAVALQ